MGSAVIPPPPGFELDDEFVPPPPGFELDSLQPPVAPIPVRQPATPRVADPFSPEQSWIREQAATKRPSFNSPVKDPSPVVQDRPGPEAVRPMAPTSIPPTVETTPVGRANAPVPGRIPGMERLGGAAPGVPPVTAQINETNAPSLAGDVGGGFVRGVASGAMAVPRALSRVPGGFRDDINSLRRTRADIEPNLGFRTPEQVAEDEARLRQISNSDINRFEQAALPAAPVTGAGKFAEALGSTAPYMAAGVAGPAGPAALGILAGTEESLGRSDASGIPLSDAQRLGVGAAGAAIGSTEALPFGRLLGRLKGAGVIADAVDETQLVKQLFPGLKDYAVSAGKQAIEEGVQEGTSNVLQDVTEASYGGRPVNRIGEGLGESVTTGGGVGALVDVLTTLAGSRAGRARLSQNGVDPAALLAWVQSQEKVDPMQAEFNALARENRAPSPPQAVPQAAPTPTPAESPAPAPPQQAEVAPQVPPPPAGFTVDPLPGAIENAPAAAPIQSSEASEMPSPVKQDAAPDDAYRAVIDFAAAEGDISTGKLQKQFKMPFGDAVRMMQRLEADGQIEPQQGRGKQKFIGQQAAQPVPAPGPREEVVQPVPVDAAAPVAEEDVIVAPRPGERVKEGQPGSRRDSLFPSEESADSFLYDQLEGTNGRANEFEVRPEDDGWRIYRKSLTTGKYHPWTYFVDGKPEWRNPKPYSTKATRLEEQAQEPDAPLSPEVAAPPSAVEAAAVEAPDAPPDPKAGLSPSQLKAIDLFRQKVGVDPMTGEVNPYLHFNMMAGEDGNLQDALNEGKERSFGPNVKDNQFSPEARKFERDYLRDLAGPGTPESGYTKIRPGAIDEQVPEAPPDPKQEADDYQKFLDNQKVQLRKQVDAAEKEWAFTNDMGDLPIVNASQVEKDWVHGTSAQSKQAIVSSGRFDPSKGERHYDYSEFGPDVSYFADANSWWHKDPEGGRAIKYDDAVGAEVSPDAKIALIRNPKDAAVLANRLGFNDWDSLDRVLNVDGLKDEPGPNTASDLQKARALSQKIRSMGIDGVYVYPYNFEDGDGPASDQLVILNHDVVRPKKEDAAPEAPGDPDKSGDGLPTVRIRRAGDPFSTPTIPIEDRGDAYMDRKFAIKARIRKGEVPSNKDMAFLSDTDRAYMVKFGEAEGVVIPPRAAKGKKPAAVVEEPVAPPAPEQPKDFQWNGPVPNFENFRGRQPNPAPEAPAGPADKQSPAIFSDPKAKEKLPDDNSRFNAIVYGKRSPAKTARGYKVETNFAVVPMSSLRISNSDNGEVNPNYPAELQPRQRDRKSSDEQIQEIIAQFDPDQLAENYLATDGAPIIGEDLAVESGNGRSMALRRIYERFPQKAKLYQDWLVENADRFGIDPEALAGIENPVLVRVRKTLPKGVSRTDFGRDANERTTGGMSPAEQAAIDARGLDQEIMRLFQPSEDGKINTMANAPFVRAFFASIVPGPDRQTLRDGEGNINPAGIKRIENAIFAKAYGDRGMIEKMAEDPDDNIKSVVGAMISAANRFISMRNAIESGDLHPRDISADLTAAAKVLSNLRFEGKSIDDYLNQVDMFGRPKVQDAILATLRDLGRSKAKFLDILNRYVDTVEAAGNPKQEGMFGPAEPPPPPLAIWSSIVERAQVDGQGSQDAAPQGGLDASRPESGDGSGKSPAKKGRRAEGEQGQSGRPADSGRAGNTVEKTKDGLQETLVTDLEARESQIAAKNDSNRPLVDMPFSLSAPEAPAPTGPDPRQDSMFGEQGDSEVVGYAPKGTLGAKPPSNGSRSKKPTPPTGPRTGTAVSRSEIVRDLSAYLGNIPIRTGGFRERAAGIFKVRQNVIRTAKALDMETISHEIGHAIHKYLWGTRKGSLVSLNLKPLRPFRDELGLLDYDQNKQRAYEGFAEYIRLRITQPAEAKQRAPKFHAWFNQKLSEAPDIAGPLKKAQEQYHRWDIQPSTVKLAKSIDTTPNHETFMKRVTDGMSDFRYNWIDDKTGLRDAVDLFQKVGATVADTANAYRLARTLSGTFTRANFAITDKTVGADNTPNGAGLGEILKPIADRDVSERNPAFQKLVDDWGINLADDGMDDFRVYIVARRLLDYRDKGLETGFTLQELKRAVADTVTPAVKEAAEELHEYSGRILDYAYEKGAMTEETREAIRSKNEFYVPLHRVMDNVSAEDAKAMLGRKMLDLNSPVLKRKGSTREIIDPLESVIKNTYAIMSFADRNAVAQALVKQAERVSDQGYLVESGIVNPMEATTFNLKEVGKDIMAALEEAGIDGSELELDHMSTIFRPNMDPRRSNGVVRVIVDGVPKLFQMDKNLIRALDNTDAQSADLFKKMAANAAASLRFGATAGNPEFILTNFFRDQGIAGIQSRNGYLPIVSGMWGAFKMLSDPKAFQEWQLAGGSTAAMMPLTRKNLRLTVDKVTKSKKDLVLTHPAQIFPLLRDALTFFGEKSEASTRFAEYLLAKGRGKSTAEAVFDSGDVSLDFERMGKIAKTVNQFVPFFSVALNASERFVEMHNPRNKKQFAQSLTKGLLGITIPTMMLWLLNKDDEEYKKVEAWKRDLFWLIPTKYFEPYVPEIFGVTAREAAGPFIRLPKVPMWGQLYGSLFERLADSLYSHNKHAFDDFEKTVFQTLLPPASIQAIKPIEEVMSNYNAFTDRPIETEFMKKLSPENRYTPTTSELSKGISKVIGGSLSPVQVEHLLLGYTAGLGRIAITAGEERSGLRKDRPAMEASERPFIRAFATPSSPYLSTDFKLFKERLEKLKQKKADFKFSKDPKYRMTSAEETKLSRLEEINESVNEIRSKQFKVYGNKALSRDEKRRQLDMMNKQRDEILKRTKPLYD